MLDMVIFFLGEFKNYTRRLDSSDRFCLLTITTRREAMCLFFVSLFGGMGTL